MHISAPIMFVGCISGINANIPTGAPVFFFFSLCASFTICVEFSAANVTGDADGSKEGANFCFFAFVIVGVVSVDRAVFRRERPGVGGEVALLPFSFSVQMSFFHFCVVPC